MKKYLQINGMPLCLHVDNASVFKVNLNNPEGLKKTQLGRALDELSIDLLFARGPQAKGRVERAHRTLQDRLVKELRLQNINSVEDANRFLTETAWLENDNDQFAFRALHSGFLHRNINDYDLDIILSHQEDRVLCNDYTISYYSYVLQLHRH